MPPTSFLVQTRSITKRKREPDAKGRHDAEDEDSTYVPNQSLTPAPLISPCSPNQLDNPESASLWHQRLGHASYDCHVTAMSHVAEAGHMSEGVKPSVLVKPATVGKTNNVGVSGMFRKYGADRAQVTQNGVLLIRSYR